MAYGQASWVPHMVRLFEEEGDLRTELGIPPEAIVLGRHGGEDSFDIPWVQRAVVEIAREHPDLWFLFLNTRSFPGTEGMANIRFLPATADPLKKRRFLNSCNAMLHGRMRGETFGLSCLEFAMLGKRVLTYTGSPERSHLEILGEAAVGYGHLQELKKLLLDLAGEKRSGESRNHNSKKPEHPGRSLGTPDLGFQEFQPEAVMKKFQEVFLG